MKQALKQFQLWYVSQTFVTICNNCKKYVTGFFKCYLFLRYNIFGPFPNISIFLYWIVKKKM